MKISKLFNSKKKYVLIIFFLCFQFSCKEKHTVKINDILTIEIELLYENQFDANLNDWQIEQMEGGKAEINGGKLEITDVGGCTIWLKRKFDEPIMIEYDVLIIGKGGPQDRVSDLNCFWMAIDPESPDDLFVNSEKRGGRFSNYDSLRLYYMGVGGHFNTKTRFRRYVGNGDRPLLPEHDFVDTEYLLEANKPYHIKIVAYKGIIQYYRNDKLLVNFKDDKPYTSGHFGFRTVNNHMTVDNFKVYHLK